MNGIMVFNTNQEFTLSCADQVINNNGNTITDFNTPTASDSTGNCNSNTAKSGVNKGSNTAYPVIHLNRPFQGDGTNEDVVLVKAKDVNIYT